MGSEMKVIWEMSDVLIQLKEIKTGKYNILKVNVEAYTQQVLDREKLIKDLR